MSLNPYVLRIEKDPESGEGKWRVVIYRIEDTRNSKLFGIPWRGDSVAAAKEAIRPLRYAFEFGLGAAREDMMRAMYSLPSLASEGS